MKMLKKLMTIIITGVLIVSSSALTSFADEYSEACPIKLGTTYKGVTSYDGEFYKFTLPKDGYVDFKFKENPKEPYTYYIKNENKDDISWGDISEGTDIETDREGLAAGIYYIEICEYATGCDNVEYEFSVNPTYTDDWEKEPNNSFAKANIIKLNQNYKGKGYNNNYNVDCYKFTLEKDGYIDINLKENTNIEYEATLYFNNENSYASYEVPIGRDVYSKRVGLPAGTYYIEIYGNENYGHENYEYEFSVNATYTDYWEKEFNDSYETANEITLNNMYNGITDSYDFYTFDAKYSDTYRIKFKQDPNVSFKYKLLDEKENCISYGTTTKGNGEETSNVDLQPGRYYVRVEKYSNEDDNTQYSFGVFSTRKEIGNFTANEVQSNSTTITGKGLSGATVTAYVDGKEIGSAVVDQSGNYKINIQPQEGGKVVVLKISQTGYIPKEISTTVKGIVEDFTVNEVKSDSTKITGTGLKGATVTAYVGQKEIGSSVVDEWGEYTIDIEPQDAGKIVVLKIEKSGYEPKEISTTVEEEDKIFENFTVNTPATTSKYISGYGEKGATVKAYRDGEKIGKTVTASSKSGYYKIYVPKLYAGEQITIEMSKTGYMTEEIYTTVNKVFTRFTVNKVSSKSTYVSGYGEKSATIRVYKNGKQIGKTTRSSSKSGYFKVSIPKQKKGTKLQVKMSKTGYRSVSKYVTVK